MSQNAVLVVNAGSSSLKFKLFELVRGALLPRVTGLLERIGDTENSAINVKYASSQDGDGEQKDSRQVPVPTHQAGLERTFDLLKDTYSATIADEVRAVGHRIVHGGSLDQSVLLDDAALREVRTATIFAPLHNPANLMGVEACTDFFHDRPQVGVFDTAFHQTMPPRAYLYALPYRLYEEHRLRRYGMHGTSYRFLLQRAAKQLSRPARDLNLIVAHLGAGSSMCCIEKGRCIDTSMGMTPLEGLVMATRSGDIDPGLLPFLSSLGHSLDDIDRLLNKQSGLLGLAGHADLRAVQQAAAEGDARCHVAQEVFVHRIRKYLGSYLLQLHGGVDAIVFSAGIGENSASIRKAVCENLSAFGIRIDDEKNAKAKGGVVSIAAADSKIDVLVIATDEELCIAQDTAALAGLGLELV